MQIFFKTARNAFIALMIMVPRWIVWVEILITFKDDSIDRMMCYYVT